MKAMKDLIDVNLLRNVPTKTKETSFALMENDDSNFPHVLDENSTSYCIVMNLLGIDEKNIGVRVNEAKREVAVLAKKEARNAKRGFFWIFGVPASGLLHSTITRYKNGVLEIVIPKSHMGSAA